MSREFRQLEKREPVGRRWGLSESTVGLFLAVLFMWLLVRWLTSGIYYDGHLALVLSYASVWIPLLGALSFACFVRGTGSLVRDFSIRFTWVDALFGLGIGLIARAAASVVEIAFYGRMSGLGVTFGETVYDGWWVFGTLLAPVLLAPVIEELFFRGLVLRSAIGITSSVLPRISAAAISVLISAGSFTALHLAEVSNGTAAAVLGISTLTFGLCSATLAAVTGRTGGSIVAHVTYNGSLVLAVLLS